MKLNQTMLAALAADYAAAYRTVATEALTLAQAKSNAAGKATEAREGLWGLFKNAIDTAIGADHSANALRVGLAVACEEAGVPSGSYRSYVATVGNMLEDVQAGRLSREEALLMKVKDARERYQDAGKKALREAKARLEAATKGWDVKALDDLTEYANAVNAEVKAAKEASEAEAQRVANG